MNDATEQGTVKLEVFIDFVCPWCYLAHHAVDRLRQQYDIEVNWSPFPLHPETPPEGMLLSDLFRGADIDAMHARLYAMMDELGLEHCDRERLFNTRKAQELALWAATDNEEAAEKLIGLLFRAYFVENRNLADADTLLDVVERAGLDRAEAADVLRQGTMAKAVDEAWARARQHQISGVPAFIGGGYQFSGYQPPRELAGFLEFIKATKRE